MRCVLLGEIDSFTKRYKILFTISQRMDLLKLRVEQELSFKVSIVIFEDYIV